MPSDNAQTSAMAVIGDALHAASATRPRVQLLRRSDRCLPADMQRHINTHDLDTLHALVTRIVQLGRPAAGTHQGARQPAAAPADAAGEAVVGSRCYDDRTHKVGALPFGSEPCPPCPPDADAPGAEAALDEGQTSLDVARVLRRYCHQLCRLLQREAVGIGRNAFAYSMPKDLQAQLVPVLYAWLVDWSFLCDHVQSWLAVMHCFAAVYRMPLVGLQRRPVYTLSWRPLLELLLGLTSPANLVVKVIRHAYDQVQHELPTLCELASYHFDADALAEMWDYCAPHFAQDGSGGPIHLVLLYLLLPPLRLCADGDGDALPLTRHIVDFLLRDAFDWQTRSAHWQAFRVKLIAKMLASNIGLMDFAPYAEPYFTALLQSLELSLEERAVSSSSSTAAAVALAIGGGGASGASAPPTRNGQAACMTNSLSPVYNDFAPFQFDRSEMLRAQTYIVNALPADTTAPLWNHLRRWLHATQSFIGQGGRGGQKPHVAMLYGSLVAIAHLRMRQQGQRGATHIAGEKTTEQTGEANANNDDDDDDDEAVVGAGEENEEVADLYADEAAEGQRGHVRPIPAAYIWTRETMSCFVDLVLPGVTTLLRAGWSDAASTMGLLCALAPGTVLPVVMRYADVGLHSVNEVESQRCHALQLLQQAMYPLVTSSTTHDAWLRYLAEVVPSVVAWMNPSAPRVSTAVIWFLFAVSEAVPLTHLLRQGRSRGGGGGEGGEEDDGEEEEAAGELLLSFVSRLLELYALNTDEQEQTLDAVHAILTHTFARRSRGGKEDTDDVAEEDEGREGAGKANTGTGEGRAAKGGGEVLARLADRVVREASNQDTSRAVFALLTVVAECAPRRVLRRVRQRVVPVLHSRASNDEEVRWAAQMLSAALAGAGAGEVFACADVVLDCVRAQLHHITNRRRVEAAAMMYETLQQTLLYPRCTVAVADGGRRRLSSRTAPADGAGDDTTSAEARGSAARTAPASCDVLAGSPRLLRRLGFCTSTQVRLRWQEPTAAHVALLLHTFDDLVEEVVYVTEHITRVSAGVAARAAEDGLRALCAAVPVTLSENTTHDCNAATAAQQSPPRAERAAAAAAAAAAAVEEEEYHSESAAPVTPHNVLCGVAQWLLEVMRINQCFYLAGAAASPVVAAPWVRESEEVTVSAQCTIAVAHQPWWDVDVRAGWPLLGGEDATPARDLTPRYSREFLFDLVARHMLRRMAGDSSALTDAFGPHAVADRLAAVPYLSAPHGQPALDAAHAQRGDVRGLQLVLALLRTLALPALRPGACPAHRLTALHETAMLGYRGMLAEPLHHVRYMPAGYWAYVAATRRHQYTFHRGCGPAARACVAALMNLAHVLLFRTGHPALSMQCAELVGSCVELMPPVLAQLLLVAHGHLLAQLALSEGGNGESGNGTSEEGSDATMVSGVDGARGAARGEVGGAEKVNNGDDDGAARDGGAAFRVATGLPRLRQLLLLRRRDEADAPHAAPDKDEEDEEEQEEGSDAEEGATRAAAGEDDGKAELGAEGSSPHSNQHGADDTPAAHSALSRAALTHLRKSVLVGGLLFALNGMLLPAVYEDTALVLALQRLLLFYPEALVYRRVGSAVRQAQRKLNNTSLYVRPGASAALLEAQISTARVLAAIAPLRASNGLDIAAALYRPSYNFVPSAAALQTLLELSISTFPALHRAASQLLRSVLLTLREPAVLRAGTNVLLRRGPLTATETTPQADRALFQRRYRVLQRRLGSVPLAKTSEVYLARSIRIPLTLPDDFFTHHGESKAAAAADLADDAPLQPPSAWCVKEPVYPFLPTSSSPVSESATRRAECVRLVQQHVSLPPALTPAAEPMAAAAASPSSTAPERLARTWAWQLLQLLQEPRRKALEHVPDRRLWAYLGEVTGAAVLVRTGTALVRATLEAFGARVDAVDIAARTSALGVFRALFELASALVYVTHRPTLRAERAAPADAGHSACDALLRERQAALETYTMLLRYTCGPSVPNELLRCMALSCRGLTELLTCDEMWAIYDALFDLIDHDGADDGGSQTVVRAVALIAQLLSVLAFETSETLLDKLLHAVRARRAVFFHHATTQGRRHTASALRQLLRLSLHATALVPQRTRLLPLLSDFVAQVEREDMPRYCLDEDAVAGGAAGRHPTAVPTAVHVDEEEDAGWTATPALTPAVARPGVPPSPAPLCGPGGVDEFVLTPLTQSAQIAPGSDVTTETQPTALSLDAPAQAQDGASNGDAQQQQPRRRGSATEVSALQHDEGTAGPTPYELSELKTMVMCWNDAPLPLLRSPASRLRHLLRFLCCVLDISLSEVDTLHDAAACTLHSIAIARLPKATVHDMVDFCCDALLASSSLSQPGQVNPGEDRECEAASCVACGTSRRAKAGLTAALRWIVFFNLHRIGRFAMLRRVAEAALHVVSHGDGRLRQEGKWLMMVLTKVCSNEQTAALVQGYLHELRGLSEEAAMDASQSRGVDAATVGTRDSNAATQQSLARRRRRTALVIGLCAVLEADPGALPSYVPRLMERLMRYAHDGPQESRRAVVRSFERWWASHRERWEFEFRDHFTPAQTEAMMSILKAPSYYA